jgi:hypothetical protein
MVVPSITDRTVDEPVGYPPDPVSHESDCVGMFAVTGCFRPAFGGSRRAVLLDLCTILEIDTSRDTGRVALDPSGWLWTSKRYVVRRSGDATED